jgi:hypothetical protein
MDDTRRQRWMVKDHVFSPWRELPGMHTPTEIWLMRGKGAFCVAMRASPTTQEDGPNGTVAGFALQPPPLEVR